MKLVAFILALLLAAPAYGQQLTHLPPGGTLSPNDLFPVTRNGVTYGATASPIGSTTRLATSAGSDVDSFVGDFGLTRLAANYATGIVTFARFTSTAQAIVPFNAAIQTADGTQNFVVETDPTNSAYNLALGGYVLAPTVATVNVPVMAVAAGAAGNVLASTITSINQAIPGVDTVVNGAAFANGLDAETDPALKARFRAFFASLSKGTKAAIQYAIANVQQGLQNTISENVDYNGTTDRGYFTVVVDDGSGYPASGLISSVYNAIDTVRALTIRFGVFPPVVVTATPSMTITSDPTYVNSTVVGNVVVALQNRINALPLGVGLPYTRLAAIAYGVPGVVNASSVLLNGGTSDIAASALQVVKCGTPTVA